MAFASPPVMSAAAPSPPPATSPATRPTYTLHSIPVSFFAARVRLLIYREPLLASSVTVAPPPGGGMKSGEHLAVNPLGKIPSLAADAPDDAFTLFESSAIVSFLLDEFDLLGSYTHATPQLRAHTAMVSAFVDSYLSPLNGALYRAMGDAERAAQLADLVRQLDVLEGVVSDGPYVVGSVLSLADVSLFGVFLLYAWAGPRYFGFRPDDAQLRPKLAAWWAMMLREGAARKVQGEVWGALERWREGGRWEKMGVPESTLFSEV